MPEVGDPGYGRDAAAAGHPETEDPGDTGHHSQPAVGGLLERDQDAGKGTAAILLAPATGRRRGLVPGVPDVCGTGGSDKEAPGTHAALRSGPGKYRPRARAPEVLEGQQSPRTHV
ncbi:hypothetical protein T09_4065 [Trichinella sp. T9]|nr:hypothetical protein T09_4065 [Trichinella sp. T9]